MIKAIGILLLLLLPPALPAAPDFAVSGLDTGMAAEQTILTAFLEDPERADLIVISVSRQNDKTLRLYELEPDGYPAAASMEMALDEAAIFVDTGRTAEGEILVVFRAGDAYRLDPRTGETRQLLTFQSIYNTPVRDSVPHLDLFRDINNDGLDDFFMPGFTGMTAYVQKQDGGFSDGVAMRALPEANLSPGSAGYRMPRCFLTDMNLDGYTDVVFWVEDHLLVYAGRPDGLFDGRGVVFSASLPFQFGDAEELNDAMGEDQSDFHGKALFNLKDLDHDGITDLVVNSVRSAGVLDKTTTYEVYNGTRTSSGDLDFPETPGSVITLKGMQIGPLENDFNGDGQVDFLIAEAEIGLGRIIKALFSGSFDIDLGFYQMTGGTYPGQPNTTRKITIRFNLSSGKVNIPAFLVEDLDGNGFAELIANNGKDTLMIYPGIDDAKLFEARSVDYTVDLPENQNGAGLAGNQDTLVPVELNNDGRPDLMIRHPSKTESNRVIFLISRPETTPVPQP